MSPDLDRDEIFEKMRGILVEVLSLRPEDVVNEARILEDLGAESIDLLDLRFRIEKAFRLRITNQNLVDAFGENTSPADFRRLFTVDALCGYVHRRLEEAVV